MTRDCSSDPRRGQGLRHDGAHSLRRVPIPKNPGARPPIGRRSSSEEAVAPPPVDPIAPRNKKKSITSCGIPQPGMGGPVPNLSLAGNSASGPRSHSPNTVSGQGSCWWRRPRIGVYADQPTKRPCRKSRAPQARRGGAARACSRGATSRPPSASCSRHAGAAPTSDRCEDPVERRRLAEPSGPSRARTRTCS
jgi:hypothetical protein